MCVPGGEKVTGVPSRHISVGEGPAAAELGSSRPRRGVHNMEPADLRVDGWAGQGQGGWVKQLGYFPKATEIHWKQGRAMHRFLF